MTYRYTKKKSHKDLKRYLLKDYEIYRTSIIPHSISYNLGYPMYLFMVLGSF